MDREPPVASPLTTLHRTDAPGSLLGRHSRYKEIKQHWQSEGRKGSSDNVLSLTVKAGS